MKYGLVWFYCISDDDVENYHKNFVQWRISEEDNLHFGFYSQID